MPYKGKAASMAIILPRKVDGLDGVMFKLAEGFDLMSALKETYNLKVQVTIPKFKIETEIDLMTVLPKVKYCDYGNLSEVHFPKITLAWNFLIQKSFFDETVIV